MAFQQIIFLTQERNYYNVYSSLLWLRQRRRLIKSLKEVSFANHRSNLSCPSKGYFGTGQDQELPALSESTCLLEKTHTKCGILNKYPFLTTARDKIIYYPFGLHATAANVSSSKYSTSRYKKQLRSAKLNFCLCEVDKIDLVFRHHFQKNFKKL